MSNRTTSSIWNDQAAIKPNSWPYSQKYMSKYYSFIKIHSRKMKHARIPLLLYGLMKATPLTDCVDPFRYIWYNRTEHLFKIIIIIITIEGIGITSKHYNIRKFTDCYGKIFNLCVKKQFWPFKDFNITHHFLFPVVCYYWQMIFSTAWWMITMLTLTMSISSKPNLNQTCQKIWKITALFWSIM